MAGTGGFFLKGLGSGLQSGFQMGQQMQEMKWQKEQRKKLEDKQKKIEESISSIGNLFKQYGADNTYSDVEIMQLNTALLASVPEVQEIYKGAINNIQTMNKAKFEEDLQWLDLFIDWTEGLDPSNVQGIFDTVKGRVQTDKGKQLFTAYDTISKKRYEAIKAQPTTEVFTTAEAVKAKYPNAGYEYSATAGGYVPTFQKPEAPKTELDIMGETGKKLDYAYATGNASHFNQMAKSLGVDTTFETYKKKYEEPEEVIGKVTPITFKTLQDIKESFNNVKTKAEYDEALASYNASKEAKASDWTPPPFENQLTELIKKVETAIWADFVNKNTGKLKDKGEREDYNEHLQYYLNLIEEAKRAGIDISQFQAFIPYKELYWGAGNPLVMSESW